MNKMVSIIIPTFNRENLLNETFTSIIKQTYTNWECIIVDDQSTDQSMDVIKTFEQSDSRFKIFSRPNTMPKGANSCRNFGIIQAQGEYLMFFDSDDLLKENCLENRVFEFERNSNFDMLIFSMGIFDYSTSPSIYSKRKVINYSLEQTIKEFIFTNTLPWNICRPIYKTFFIKNRIIFNEKIQNFQDDEFNLRVLFHLKPKYLSIDYTDCYYRFDSESVNKYNNLIGNQNVVNSLFEYYKTVFEVLDYNSKIEYRNKLLKKLFNHIKLFVCPNLNLKLLNKTIKIFNKELNLTFKEYFLIHSIKLLNNHFLNIKGYYYLSKNIKKLLFKN